MKIELDWYDVNGFLPSTRLEKENYNVFVLTHDEQILKAVYKRTTNEFELLISKGVIPLSDVKAWMYEVDAVNAVIGQYKPWPP